MGPYLACRRPPATIDPIAAGGPVMRRHALMAALALGLLAAGTSLAAPAPPDRLVTAEVVLRLDDPAALTAVAGKLRSAAVLREVVGWQKVRQMSCIKGEKDPAGWLASRLEVT